MKINFGAIVLLLVSFSVFADPLIVLEPDLSREVSDSSSLKNNIYSLGFLNSTCTGAQISREGHVLLARHCLESTIGWGQLRTENTPVVFVNKQQLNEVPQLTSVTYNLHELKKNLGFHVGFDSGIVPASIFFSGPGEIFPRFEYDIKESSVKKIHNSLTDRGYSDGGDVAIVLIPALSGRSCLRLATKPLKEGEQVRTISYPCFQDEGYDWPQDRTGKVLLDSLQNAVDFSGFKVSKGNFLIGHKSQSCNSGSPVFNSRGEISGVVYGGLSNEGKGVTMAAHLARATELMDETDREKIMKLNSSCESLR